MKAIWEIDDILKFGNRLSDYANFEKNLGKTTQEIAKLLHKMLIKNTPVDFGTLQSFWKTDENYSYLVERVENGFAVTLINRAMYAKWVNNGHRQRPGRFIPGYWEGTHFRYDPNADGGMVLKKSWVKGRFFVEKSILTLENTSELNKIIYKELKKWFGWCVNGK